ncbi:modulator of macroautophagy TMEM150B isoform X1 [Zalophus californianus]|uniref:Modulator of macroautophagy TMEM150B isoform X1 n=1 Tax=Zalophus californianus TaxID=9704 RepID=A0A6J2EYW6_ZALCA|nr:modulator of macroautophagy TMEM150B isoform X1 [Zalophus californianus]XP_027474261.1 modulator of macroautophagy TMEM150B isoform X1 [Zalophus californianus]
MWGYLSLLPAFLALWATAGVWTVFALAVTNRSVNLTEGFPYISLCGSYPPQSCIFSQLLNMGAAMAAWICIIRYHQLRDWGVGKWFNQLILWTGLLCALGTSVVGNFQQKNQLPTHLIGAFFALFVGNLYFWLQLFLFWRMRSLPQPGAPWIRLLRLGLCSLCTILMVANILPGASVGVFATQKLANVANQSWLLTIYQHAYHRLKTLPSPVLSHPSPDAFRQPGTPPETRTQAGSRETRFPSGEQIRTEGCERKGESRGRGAREGGVGDTGTDGPLRPDLLSHPDQPPSLPHPTPQRD